MKKTAKKTKKTQTTDDFLVLNFKKLLKEKNTQEFIKNIQQTYLIDERCTKKELEELVEIYLPFDLPQITIAKVNGGEKTTQKIAGMCQDFIKKRYGTESETQASMLFMYIFFKSILTHQIKHIKSSTEIISLGGITKAVYDKKHQELRDQIQILEIEMSEHSKADFEYQNTVATVISLARKARTIFDNSSEPARKREFLNYLLQNPTVKGKKLYFTIASPFNLVLDLANCPTWLTVSSSELFDSLPHNAFS